MENRSPFLTLLLSIGLFVLAIIIYAQARTLDFMIFRYTALACVFLAGHYIARSIVYLYRPPLATTVATTPILYEESATASSTKSSHDATVANGVLQQRIYLDKGYGQRKTILVQLSRQIVPMHNQCLLAINLPAYRESQFIYKTLWEYTVKQKNADNQHLVPELFEINILINSPRPNIPLDEATEQEVLRFKKDYPHYHVHLLKHTFDFPDKPMMGFIYKTLTDLTIYRSLQRHYSSLKERLILRTGGADAGEKNAYFLARILEVFTNPQIAVYKSESRYPSAVLQKCPLLHILYVLESGLNRLYTRGQSHVGLGSYLATVYAEVGGFNQKLAIAEEIDLAKRIAQTITQHPEKYRLKRDLRKNAIENPRRALWALYTQKGMANKYLDFGKNEVENAIRTHDWQALLLNHELPSHLQLTAETLSREISHYYRYYLTRIANHSQRLSTFRKTHPQATQEEARQQIYVIANQLFSKIFFYLGIPRGTYTFVQRNPLIFNSEAQVIIADISHLL